MGRLKCYTLDWVHTLRVHPVCSCCFIQVTASQAWKITVWVALLKQEGKDWKNSGIFLHVKAEQHAKIGTQTICFSLLIPIVRERTSWVEVQDLVEANKSWQKCVQWKCQGAGLWDQPTQQDAADTGVPSTQQNPWALEVFLLVWRRRLCKEKKKKKSIQAFKTVSDLN